MFETSLHAREGIEGQVQRVRAPCRLLLSYADQQKCTAWTMFTLVL